MSNGNKYPKKSAGGKARAKALSPIRRSEIAKNAALERWGIKATHRGNFREFGIDVECYVLNNNQKSAVISQGGMAVALGFKNGTAYCFRHFMECKVIDSYLGVELRKKIENPVKFKLPNMEPRNPSEIFGYDVSVLTEICKAIASADKDDVLLAHQKPIAKQAAIILGASAELGMQNLVYSLSGYDQKREETIADFKRYVAEETLGYEREFPEQLYLEWYRLYGLTIPEGENTWKLQHLMVEHVYWFLAKNRGRILEFTRVQETKAEDRCKKLHKFLSNVGAKALRQHLGQLLSAAQLSDSHEDYEKNVRRLFGDLHENLPR